MVYPKPLKPGDTVAIIGIAGCVRGEDRRKTVEEHAKNLEMMGFRVKIDPSACGRWGYMAGTDEERAAALTNAFLDDEVNGIWCVRGGYGCIRILDKIDWDAIAKHPKVFVGYSDITAIHTVLQERCGMATFHGPMVVTDEYTGANLESLRYAVTGHPDRALINPDGTELKRLRPGRAEGRLVGGNLSLIASTIGTPYELDTWGKILFLEDVGEHVYTMDRYLQTLRLAGKLDGCAGIIFGGFDDVEGDGEDFSMLDILRGIVEPLRVPVIAGLQAGHMKQKLTLCLGHTYRMDADARSITLID